MVLPFAPACRPRLCGGQDYNPRFNAFFGYFCEQAVGSLRANILFMSTSTVLGTTAYQQEEVVKVKRALMSAADTKVLLIDSSKFGKTALIRLAALTEFDEVITDSGLPPEDAEALRKDGVRLRVVEVRSGDRKRAQPAGAAGLRPRYARARLGKSTYVATHLKYGGNRPPRLIACIS